MFQILLHAAHLVYRNVMTQNVIPVKNHHRHSPHRFSDLVLISNLVIKNDQVYTPVGFFFFHSCLLSEGRCKVNV